MEATLKDFYCPGTMCCGLPAEPMNNCGAREGTGDLTEILERMIQPQEAKIGTLQLPLSRLWLQTEVVYED